MKKAILLSILLAFVSIAFSKAFAQDYALDFGEIDDFRFIMVGSDTRFDTDCVTVEAWIKPTSLPTGTYIYEGRSTIIWNGDQAAGRDPYIFYINEFGALEAHIDFNDGGPGLFIVDTTPVLLNEWQHVALTIDPTQICLFLDGQLMQQLIHNRGPAVKNHSRVAIGRHLWYKNPFGGVMDEMRIWGVALTAQEIRDGMYHQLTGLESGLVAYWDFNEGTGQIVHDSSPNAIQGVLGLNYTVEEYDPIWIPSQRPKTPPMLAILIDIKPGSYPNSINLISKGVVPVAILTTSGFNAWDVDPYSIEFASAAPGRWTMEDVDRDGNLDMLFHFYTQDLNLTNESTEATLTGETSDGTPIKGTDTVNIVPGGKWR